ncbi:MAG: hypothetical protein Q9227_008274 [Pyrenula ochraceoflavens]
MDRFPTITLDTTLAELYQKNLPNGQRPRIAIIPCGWTSGVDLGPDMPRNKKLIFQDPVTMAAYRDASQFQTEDASREMQLKFLAMVSQRDALGAGDMGVVIFEFDSKEQNRSASREEVGRTIAQLAPHQQPQLLLCKNPDGLKECLRKGNIDLVLPKLPLDCLEQVSLTCSVDASYYLHSKTGLTESGLPIPKSTIIAPPAFSDTPEWREKAKSHVISQIAAQTPPFVLKTNQSGGGGGVFIVRDQSAKDSTLEDFSSHIIPNLLASVTTSNAYLAPANLVIQEFIPTTTGNWGLTFFLGASGTCTFLQAPTQQLSSDGSSWLGNRLSFPDRDRLERKLSPIMHEIGAWLHKHGYYGPAGADVVETESGELLVVDVNSRIPGAWTISLMQGFFERERGFHEACSQNVTVKMPREEFVGMEKLKRFFEEGRAVIVSWYWDEVRKVSYGTLFVAGEGEKEMEEVLEECMKFAEVEEL